MTDVVVSTKPDGSVVCSSCGVVLAQEDSNQHGDYLRYEGWIHPSHYLRKKHLTMHVEQSRSKLTTKLAQRKFSAK